MRFEAAVRNAVDAIRALDDVSGLLEQTLDFCGCKFIFVVVITGFPFRLDFPAVFLGASRFLRALQIPVVDINLELDRKSTRLNSSH